MKVCKSLTIAMAAICSLAISGSAQADTVAGWDFSQYFSGGGFLSTDGLTLQNTLDANYSHLDPTFNAGLESAAFGTMYIDGTNGSSLVTPVGDGSEAFLPISGSLISNLTGTVLAPGDSGFDSLAILTSEGQTYADYLRMRAQSAVDVVFMADLSSSAYLGSAWEVAFGGQTDGLATTANVGVAWSTDGVNFTNVGTAGLSNTDALYSYSLSPANSNDMWVRLSFDNSGWGTIDNLSINAILAPVPEPGTALLLGAGLLGLAGFGRKRAA